MNAIAKFDSMKAAADTLANGAIEVNMYESEIADMVRRESIALQRFDAPPASGAPHRYFEQTAIVTGGFVDPRSIAPTPGGATRVERSAAIKAISAESDFGLFDVQVTQQQGKFAYVEAKDVEDVTSAVVVTAASAVWSGTDTSLTTPTTQQYMGLLRQISQQKQIALGASIIDGLKAQVAAIVANPTYKVRPTAIYVNPILGDLIDREAKASAIKLSEVVIAGVTVEAIETQAGRLPLIPEAYLPATTDNSYGFTTPGSGNSNYFAVIVTEPWIEMPYINPNGGKNPQLFQLGLLAGLQKKWVAVWFNAVIAKGPSYAHAVVAVTRPTGG
jgi:hypothetical protein